MRRTALARVLRSNDPSILVLQLAVVSIVLTLVTGPSAALFCEIWCAPAELATTGCHNPDPGASVSVTTDDTCDRPMFPTFSREDFRHVRSAPDLLPGIVVPDSLHAHHARGACAASRTARCSNCDHPPLTALRL
jgi:hypothetical protein